MRFINRKKKEKQKKSSPKNYKDAYLLILDAYRVYINNSVRYKWILKLLSFIIIWFMLGVLIYILWKTISCSFNLFMQMQALNNTSISVIAGAITSVLSVFGTIMTAIIKLPQIVADYLFNKNEDKLMNEVIRDIQKYDIETQQISKQNELNEKINDVKKEDSQFSLPSENKNENEITNLYKMLIEEPNYISKAKKN